MTPSDVRINTGSLGAGTAAKARFRYLPAVGPKLRVLLFLLFAFFAALGATGAYLATITFLNWADSSRLYTTPFTFWMLLAHCAVGLLGIALFLFFGIVHLVTAWQRPNRVAVRLGLLVLALGLIVSVSGLGLFRLRGLPQLQTGTPARMIAYLVHVTFPFFTVWAYVAHRRAGPRIQWRWLNYWAGAVLAFVAAMAVFHVVNPSSYFREGPREGAQYFYPSEARTESGKFIPASALMMDSYCMSCHKDIYDDHLHSAHRFSSFNNPPYLFSVRETREVAKRRDGNVQASRWCAGCHDVVPFFSGAFDDPNFDDVNHPTAQAGITCVACHAITHVSSPIGNAAYTIAEPQHYPFAFAKNAALLWINNQLILAKPDLHKKTFLKDLHRDPEFCSTCHKVHLPVALNHYKDFLRGQDHHDSFIQSGLGHGARSFYYPPQAMKGCADCHMPYRRSPLDPAARDHDGSGELTVRGHSFPGANTGLFSLLAQDERYASLKPDLEKMIQTEVEFLQGTDPNGKDKKLRIDLFGLKNFRADGSVDEATLAAPLRPQLPTLQPGQSYLLEVVIRTLLIGHHFSQGTTDSNEIWVELEARSADRVFARSGSLAQADDSGPVDEQAHFVNVLMLDRDGNRINRRNPQDIFTPLYDHQIAPGSGQVVHYRLDIPQGMTGPVELRARLRYRKFDFEYMKLVHKDRPVPKLPIVDICEDRVVLPVAGQAVPSPTQPGSPAPTWQRWNDYGIGCLLEGGAGAKRGNLRQAEAAFAKLLVLGQREAVPQGHVNLARVYIEQGRLSEAAAALNAARACDPPASWWTLAWFSGLVTAENANDSGDLDAAIASFESIVDPMNQPRERKFDFTKDTVVLDRLGLTLYKRSQLEAENPVENRDILLRAISAYERALTVDPEDLDAHYGLSQCFARLSDELPTRGPVAEATGNSPQLLLESASLVANRKESMSRRIEEVARLSDLLADLGRRSPDPLTPRLPVLRELQPILHGAFHAENGSKMRASIAAVLGTLHRELHTLYKPDDSARAHATEVYRSKHPAANAAAEAIVIHRLSPVSQR
jgi:tetratricopeptide (TPR) repeat protein